MSLYHYTDQAGFNAIKSQVVWRFAAAQPPGKHPFGAYFTCLVKDTRNLAQRLRIPRSKIAYYFEFTDVGDLTPIALEVEGSSFSIRPRTTTSINPGNSIMVRYE